MQLNIQTRRTWTPDILDNDKQPEGQRIEIDYRRPPAYARSNWRHEVARRNSEGKMETYADVDVRAVVRNSDVHIRGLRISIDGKDPVEITTGEQLADSTSDYCYFLATRLAMEILNLDVDAELIKNSGPDSGPSS